MASKRGNNEGSIFKRKDGRWCAQVSLNGRRITKYSKTQGVWATARMLFNWLACGIRIHGIPEWQDGVAIVPAV